MKICRDTKHTIKKLINRQTAAMCCVITTFAPSPKMACSTISGTGNQEGLPSNAPNLSHISDNLTGLGAVPLMTPAPRQYTFIMKASLLSDAIHVQQTEYQACIAGTSSIHTGLAVFQKHKQTRLREKRASMVKSGKHGIIRSTCTLGKRQVAVV